MSPTPAEGLGRGLRLWRMQVARTAALAPTTVVTALSAIWVLLTHRLSAGRGDGSILAARPIAERRPAPPERGDERAVRPAA
jgi:hypothetical protein